MSACQSWLASVTTETYDNGSPETRTRTTYEYDSESFRVGIVNEVDAALDGNFTVTDEVEFLTDRHGATGYTQAIRETKTENGNELVTDYTFGTDELAQRVHGVDADGNAVDQRHVFGHDGHGSVRVLYDLQQVLHGVLDELISYSAHGEVIGVHDATGSLAGTDQSAASTSIGFSGERYDTATGGQYLRARYYDPATGRFNRLDPFFGNVADPQSFHKYTYGHDDPVNNVDPSGMISIGGMMSSMATMGKMIAMNAGAQYAAKQFAISVIETSVEVVIVNLISVFTGVKPDHGWDDIARSLGTNYLSNLVTAGIGNKGKWAVVARNLIDFSIRMISDVYVGGEDPIWAAGLNLAGMVGSGLVLLTKYGKKLLGGCVGRFGGCFVAGTPVAASLQPSLMDRTNPRAEGLLLAEHVAVSVRPIEAIALGARVVATKPPHSEDGNAFGVPESATWRQLRVLQHRADGTKIEMELIRPMWLVAMFGLQPGSKIEMRFPDLETFGYAEVLEISGCPEIESGEGEVVIGRFLTRQATNLMRVECCDGVEFIGTSNHRVWSLEAEDWRCIADLEAGDRLEGLDTEHVVSSVEKVSQPADVFNLEVDTAHCYRITQSAILVHNSDYAKELMEQAMSSAQKIARKFTPDQFACDKCAAAMKESLQALGVSGKVVELRFPDAHRGFVISDSFPNQAISSNGFHTGVLLDGKVYCPVHPDGLPYNQWVDDFIATGSKQVDEIDF